MYPKKKATECLLVRYNKKVADSSQIPITWGITLSTTLFSDTPHLAPSQSLIRKKEFFYMAVLRTSKIDLDVNGEGAYAYLVEPDDTAKHPGLVLIQEWWGIEPHIQDLAHK